MFGTPRCDAIDRTHHQVARRKLGAPVILWHEAMAAADGGSLRTPPSPTPLR
jgi:hypothetical protein